MLRSMLSLLISQAPMLPAEAQAHSTCAQCYRAITESQGNGNHANIHSHMPQPYGGMLKHQTNDTTWTMNEVVGPGCTLHSP